jgi:hypothetical protein
VLPDGSCVVTGFLTAGDAVTFGAGEVGAVTFVPVGEASAFVARYRTDGTLADLRATSGTSGSGTGVAVLPDGAAFVTGTFATTATFFPGELVSSGDQDAFVLRAAPSGEADWVRGAGGADSADSADAVAIAADGSIVVVGRAGGVFLAGYEP